MVTAADTTSSVAGSALAAVRQNGLADLDTRHGCGSSAAGGRAATAMMRAPTVLLRAPLPALRFATAALALVCVSLPSPWARGAEQHRSQRRVHNLPAIQVISRSHWTLAEEFNVADVEALSNSTIDYGLDDDWNAGISILNAVVHPDGANSPWDPDVLVNIEKSARLAASWTLVLGTQIGTAPWDAVRSTQVEHFTYLDNQMPFGTGQGTLHAGMYVANGPMSGSGTVLGYGIGIDLHLRQMPLSFNIDYVSGRNNLSTLTLGCRWQLQARLTVGLGVQVAAPGYADDATALLGLYWQ